MVYGLLPWTGQYWCTVVIIFFSTSLHGFEWMKLCDAKKKNLSPRVLWHRLHETRSHPHSDFRWASMCKKRLQIDEAATQGLDVYDGSPEVLSAHVLSCGGGFSFSFALFCFLHLEFVGCLSSRGWFVWWLSFPFYSRRIKQVACFHLLLISLPKSEL